jgi:prepilin-type N-terminal cleavage/methylation domain-containing protein
MQLMNSKNKGFTIVELLIAMAIFGILIAIASGAIVQYLRIQSDQEAITSAQSKLRRVTELVSQELRSAVFGSIINSPYTSDKSAISFLLLEGGAGYAVNPHDSGNNNSFMSAANLTINSSATDTAALGIADNDQLLMVNGNGQALFFNVGNITKTGQDWRIVHPGCGNTIDYTPGTTLLFKVRSFGIKHDKPSKELRATDGSTPEQPLAYNITNFRVDYVYNDVPQGTYDPSKVNDLDRLQIVISTEELSRGKSIERTYSSQIELPTTSLRIGVFNVCP